MARFVKGDIVVCPFPFSDLTSTVKRPAYVINSLKGSDIILCQITSKQRPDLITIDLKKEDVKGSMRINSFIRPSRIFTLDKSIIHYKLGNVNREKINEIEGKIVKIIKA